MKAESTKKKLQRLLAEESKQLNDEINSPLWRIDCACEGGTVTGNYYPDLALQALAKQFSDILKPTQKRVAHFARRRALSIKDARRTLLKEREFEVNKLLDTARTILHSQFRAKIEECLIQFSNEVLVQTLRTEGIPRVGRIKSDKIDALINRATRSITHLSKGRMSKRNVRRAILLRKIYQVFNSLNTQEEVASSLGYGDVRGFRKAMKAVSISWEQELKPLKRR